MGKPLLVMVALMAVFSVPAVANEWVFVCREQSAVGFDNVTTDGPDGIPVRPLDKYRVASQLVLRRYFVRVRGAVVAVSLNEGGPRYYRYRCQPHDPLRADTLVCTSPFNETMTINMRTLRFVFADASGFVDVPNPMRLSYGLCERGQQP